MATRSSNRKSAPPDVDTLSEVPLYLVFGGDEYIVSRSARRLVDRLCPPADQALGLEIIDPQGETIAEAVNSLAAARAAAQTVGLFGGRKVVWLRDASFLKNARTIQSDDTKAAIEMFVDTIKRGLAPGIVLVLSAPAIDKRTSLYKTFAAGGHALEYALPDKPYQVEEQARRRAGELIREAGLTIDAHTVDHLVAKAGTDTRQIAQEVDKLRVYLGTRTAVTDDDVRDMVSPAREAVSWDLEDAVGHKDLREAMHVLGGLVFRGESPVFMIIRIENRLRDLMLFQHCLKKRWCRMRTSGNFINLDWSTGAEIDEALSPLKKKDPRTLNPFRAGRLASQASKWSTRELVNARESVLTAHEDAMRSRLPKSLIVEFLILRLIGADPGEARARAG